jgi:hypothetical protein
VLHDVGAAQQLEAANLGRGELERADVEPLVEGVLPGKRSSPTISRCSVGRRKRIRSDSPSNSAMVVDPITGGGEAQLGPSRWTARVST